MRIWGIRYTCGTVLSVFLRHMPHMYHYYQMYVFEVCVTYATLFLKVCIWVCRIKMWYYLECVFEACYIHVCIYGIRQTCSTILNMRIWGMCFIYGYIYKCIFEAYATYVALLFKSLHLRHRLWHRFLRLCIWGAISGTLVKSVFGAHICSYKRTLFLICRSFVFAIKLFWCANMVIHVNEHDFTHLWPGDPYHVQYIPRNMHTVFALLCFVVVIHWLIFPYPSGLLHWHWGNLTIAPVPAKQPWWIWINTSCEFIMNDCITTTKQSTTKPCAYFLGYTVRTHTQTHTKLPIIWIM